MPLFACACSCTDLPSKIAYHKINHTEAEVPDLEAANLHFRSTQGIGQAIFCVAAHKRGGWDA